MEFTMLVGRTDDIDPLFVNDPTGLGAWLNVDFVPDITAFDPDKGASDRQTVLERADVRSQRQDRQVVDHLNERLRDASDDQTPAGTNPGSQRPAVPFLRMEGGDLTIAGMKPHHYKRKRKTAL